MGDTSLVSFNTTSHASTASVWQRYVVQHKKLINWQLITENKRKQIARDNIRENTERIPHKYQVGDEVLCIKKGIHRKYSKGKSEPYKITAVHTNGTVTIAQGVKHQTTSIRNIELYFTK